MADTFQVVVFAETPDDADRFIREYVLEAIDRLRELDACQRVWFVPGSDPETGERSVVAMTIEGDPDTIIDHEEDRWNSFVGDGLITRWEHEKKRYEEDPAERLGEKTAEWIPILNQLEAEMAKLAYETFEEHGTVPGAIDLYPEQDGEQQLGWWSVLHTVTYQLNYSLDEELDAYRYGIEHTLRNFAEFEGEDEAEARLDELINTLEAKREEIKEGRLSP